MIARIVVRSFFRIRTNKRSLSISVGEGLAPPAVLFCSYPLHAAGASPRPTVYNDMRCAAILFVRAVCFIRAIAYLRSKCAMKRSGILNRPYKNNKTLSLPVGAITYLRSKCAMKRSEILIARNVVRSIFRLRTNKRLPTNSVGGDVLDAPSRCSHYLSASHKQTFSIDLGRGGACSSRRFVLFLSFACGGSKPPPYGL